MPFSPALVLRGRARVGVKLAFRRNGVGGKTDLLAGPKMNPAGVCLRVVNKIKVGTLEVRTMRVALLRVLLIPPVAALWLAPIGCQTTTQTTPMNTSVSNPGPAGSVNDFSSEGTTHNPNEILGGDTSPARLQDIGGYIMLFYRQYKRMPASLDELKTMPGGDEVNILSPSGQPFGYYPDGAWTSKQPQKCVIAYDPAVSPNGFRWCLLMSLPKGNAGSLSVEAVSLPDSNFREYKP